MQPRRNYPGPLPAQGAYRARLLISALLILVPCFLVTIVRAQDLEPRTYTNLPMGQSFVGVGYAYSDGEINPSPSVPLRDIEITMKSTMAAYLRSLDLGGKAGKVDAAWGRVCMDGSGFIQNQFIAGDRCGTTDPTVRLSYLFYGAPAMNMEEFRRNTSQRVIGVSLRITAPLGDYNNENLINTGSNRWTFIPEIGISNNWGRLSVEGAFGARLFTDNDNFFGGTKLEQKPLYQLQAHIIYSLSNGRWVSLNSNYFWGGRTSTDKVKGDDLQKNSRIGLTLGWPLTAQHTLRLFANRGVITNIGNDSNTFGLIWQYRWADSSN